MKTIRCVARGLHAPMLSCTIFAHIRGRNLKFVMNSMIMGRNARLHSHTPVLCNATSNLFTKRRRKKSAIGSLKKGQWRVQNVACVLERTRLYKHTSIWCIRTRRTMFVITYLRTVYEKGRNVECFLGVRKNCRCISSITQGCIVMYVSSLTTVGYCVERAVRRHQTWRSMS